MKQRHKGFTIVELLVVISIIGLLSAIATVALGNARKQARDNRRIQDLKQIQTAVELYYKDNKKYPEPALGYWDGNPNAIGKGSGHCFGYNGLQWGNTDDYIKDLEAQKYISDLPRDPRFDTNGNGLGIMPQCYVYQATDGSEGHYKIEAFGVVESYCGADLSDTCNPSYLQAMDDPQRTGAYMAIYDNTSRNW